LAYLPLLLAVTVVGWCGGRILAVRAQQQKSLLWWRPAVLVVLLVPLIVFKYWNWIAGDVSELGIWLGLDVSVPGVELPLPVGISFFTFQALAYVIDCGRTGNSETSFGRFATFIGFFPQLVAGPIVRREELLPQLRNLPLLQTHQAGRGLFRIMRGMVKKILLADVLRVGIVDPLFLDPTKFTGIELLVGLYAYTLQIYYDFSGYTDIAIGTALLFGIKLPENFRRPYKATSVGEFWRRWHITLSNWVRDYIYYPLGGARVQSWRIYTNILITMVVIGVWHGAAWNFVLYGVVHGIGVGVNRAIRARTGRRPGDPLPSTWSWLWRFLMTFHFVVLARVLFRARDLGTAWDYFLGLFCGGWVFPRFSGIAWAMFVLGFVIHFSPDDWQRAGQEGCRRLGPYGWVVVGGLVGLACMMLGTGEQLAFIYYAF